MRILIVEDNPVLAFMAVSTLEAAGHHVEGPAFTVNEAIQIASGERLDLALVDINLDGHDEGIALARRLLAVHGVATVFVSGQVAAARANKDAALALLRKPYEPSELVDSACVAQALLAGREPPPPPLPHSLELFGRATH